MNLAIAGCKTYATNFKGLEGEWNRPSDRISDPEGYFERPGYASDPEGYYKSGWSRPSRSGSKPENRPKSDSTPCKSTPMLSSEAACDRNKKVNDILKQVPKLLATACAMNEADVTFKKDENGCNVATQGKGDSFMFETRTGSGDIYIGNNNQQIFISEGKPVTMYVDVKNPEKYITHDVEKGETRVRFDEGETVFYGDNLSKRVDFDKDKKEIKVGSHCNFTA